MHFRSPCYFDEAERTTREVALRCLEKDLRWLRDGEIDVKTFRAYIEAPLLTLDRPTRSEQSLEGTGVNGLMPVGQGDEL